MNPRSLPLVQGCAVLVAALASQGCLTPRSSLLMTTAAPIGTGVLDLSVGTGIGIGSQLNPPGATTTNAQGEPETPQERAVGLALPYAEANLQYGLNRRIGLNFHMSPAGLQPAAKFTLTRSKVVFFSIMPSIAFGYGSSQVTDTITGQDGKATPVRDVTTTSFSFLTGLKFLFSHVSGFFIAAGVDYQFHRWFTGLPGTATTDLFRSTVSMHSAAFGFNTGLEVGLGEQKLIRLRPEVAFNVAPFAGFEASQVGSNTNSLPRANGLSWAIVPAVSLSIVTPRSKEAEEAEAQAEQEELERAAEEARAAEEEEKARDEEAQVKRKAKKKKRVVEEEEGEEEEAGPRRKRVEPPTEEETAPEEEEAPPPKKKKKPVQEEE